MKERVIQTTRPRDNVASRCDTRKLFHVRLLACKGPNHKVCVHDLRVREQEIDLLGEGALYREVKPIDLVLNS